MVLRDPSIIKEKAGKQEVIMPAPLTSNLISFVWQDGELVDKSPHEYKGVNTYPNMENKPFDQMFTLKDGEYNYRGVQFKKQGLVVQLLINIDAELLSVKDLERTLALRDTGIGIKEEEQERIFDRFFRSKEVRAKGIEGSGIGLSLLKSIALGLGIRLHLESVYEEGTTFTLSIPTHLR